MPGIEGAVSCGYNAACKANPSPFPAQRVPAFSRFHQPTEAAAHDTPRARVLHERLDAATLALVRDLTRVDELLFAEALSSFVARARRVENATGVALLCDLDDPPASGA